MTKFVVAKRACGDEVVFVNADKIRQIIPAEDGALIIHFGEGRAIAVTGDIEKFISAQARSK